ncbi:21 kDa protein-like [Cornus florida]|uniref:21 kDa protein-like n=1 Tax=Cornus florida TaxID=4283 RepID=UPI00289B93B1|nr:21 kDa protein-like [Cornus florida]
MARATIYLLPLLILTLLYLSGTAEPASSTAAASSLNFIKASCSATRYPALCVKSLSNYASAIQKSPRQLAQTALNVSLTRAESTRKFVTKLTKFKGLKSREYAAIRDCLEEIGDSVDRLSKSIGELKHMGKAHGPDFLWHMSNVETWVSAALTDESTCMDGFAGRALDGRIKTSIRAWVTHVAQVTSNALALVNQLAA